MREDEEQGTAVVVALEKEALEHAEPIVLLFQKTTRKSEETRFDVGGIVVFRG